MGQKCDPLSSLTPSLRYVIEDNTLKARLRGLEAKAKDRDFVLDVSSRSRTVVDDPVPV